MGLHVHDPDKEGRDAGELCGLGPTGVVATRDTRRVLALRPDCVLYMQQGYDVDVLCALLESGVNVVATCGGFHHPGSMDPAVRQRIEAACAIAAAPRSTAPGSARGSSPRRCRSS